MTKRIAEILKRLDEAYGTEYVCYLNHETPWQLLIAVILSAQCTDARVNIVTKDLFQKYPSLEAFANADLKELEQDIHSTGFYHNKAKTSFLCQNLSGKIRRRSAKGIRRADRISGSRQKDRKCHPWKHLP